MDVTLAGVSKHVVGEAAGEVVCRISATTLGLPPSDGTISTFSIALIVAEPPPLRRDQIDLFSIALIRAASRQIPAIASTNEGPEKGNLIFIRKELNLKLSGEEVYYTISSNITRKDHSV